MGSSVAAQPYRYLPPDARPEFPAGLPEGASASHTFVPTPNSKAMTASLDTPDHLSAPLDLQPKLPGAWPDAAKSTPASEGSIPPGSLVRARAAAQQYDRNAIAWARLAQAA